MKELGRYLKRYLRGIDLLLLLLCLLASGFGVVLISSAANGYPAGSAGFVKTQLVSIGLGVIAYLLMSAVDLEWLATRMWKLILPFNIGLILLLKTPLGVRVGGNLSWLNIPGLPFNLGAPELVKVTFILLLAAQIHYLRDHINGVLQMGSVIGHTFMMVGIIVLICGDYGVALIYVAILIMMMIGAGIKPIWFMAGAAAVAGVFPIVWTQFLTDRHKDRILIILNPAMDPLDTGWHMLYSMETLSSGRLLGEGLYQGTRTQSGKFFAGHNDFIFSICGEELGFIGCSAIILLLTLIIVRIFVIGRRARSGMGPLICFGVAGMIMFQSYENILMCMGLTPIIGITLPFISYGGSSNIVLFASMGLVSSVKFHPRMTWLDH